jgi:23S rRNA (guanine2445-N2)-methyltransferase / 23S rRNA (guanine2069-N7)-methyltransferase
VRSQRSEGLIFVDPQSFSRSKRMTGTLDVQRVHVQLMRAAASLLEADGLLIFSTHAVRFSLDVAGLSNLPIKDIARQLLPRDFARHPPLRCFGLQIRAD